MKLMYPLAICFLLLILSGCAKIQQQERHDLNRRAVCVYFAMAPAGSSNYAFVKEERPWARDRVLLVARRMDSVHLEIVNDTLAKAYIYKYTSQGPELRDSLSLLMGENAETILWRPH